MLPLIALTAVSSLRCSDQFEIMSVDIEVVEENWQPARPTIRERSKFIFNNDLFSDVKFIISRTDMESESERRKQVIPAHKLVLAIGSPVFEAMFYGELAETADSIELPDCDYDSLFELFRYMYSDEVNLSGSNVMGVLYLAKKYMVPSLADECLEYLEDNVDPSNVFSILPSAQKYEEKSLVDRCWEVIDKQTEEAVKSDGFAAIESSLLESVVERDTLTIEEIELFKAVDLWAAKECERQGLVVGGALKRRVLGETLIKALRFPTMKMEDFASVVLDSKILTPDEVVTIIKCLSLVLRSPVDFPEMQRCGFKGKIQRCCRFTSFITHKRSPNSPASSEYALNFSVDKNISLQGVRFFGGNVLDIFSIYLVVEDTKKKRAIVSKTGEFVLDMLQNNAGVYVGFEVLFDRSAFLRKDNKYCIQAKVNGYSVWGGEEREISPLICSGVTFTFDEDGPKEFPELLFTL